MYQSNSYSHACSMQNFEKVISNTPFFKNVASLYFLRQLIKSELLHAKMKKKRFVLPNGSSWERPRPAGEAHHDAACLPGLQTFGPFSSHCANAPTYP